MPRPNFREIADKQNISVEEAMADYGDYLDDKTKDDKIEQEHKQKQNATAKQPHNPQTHNKAR